MLYAIIGDTIGFGNGYFEFNYGVSKQVKNNKEAENLSTFTIQLVFEFINRGGFTGFDLKYEKLIASDDSILSLAVFDAIKNSLDKPSSQVVEIIKNKLLEYYLNDELKEKRYYGTRTTLSLNRIKNKEDWQRRAFSDNAGGSGASMRCMPIGLFYHGKENRDKLLSVSIDSSRVTHNNPIGYLGGFSSALFTALAIEGVDPKKWIVILKEMFENETVHNYIKKTIGVKTPNELKFHMREVENFYRYLNTYYKWRFDKGELKIKKSMANLAYRNFLFYQKFSDTSIYHPGSNGIDSVLLAYDSIISCEGSFEKLIYLAMLHGGDSDSTGCIAGALFGAYYGNVDLPKNLTQIELQNQLDNLFNN